MAKCLSQAGPRISARGGGSIPPRTFGPPRDIHETSPFENPPPEYRARESFGVVDGAKMSVWGWSEGVWVYVKEAAGGVPPLDFFRFTWYEVPMRVGRLAGYSVGYRGMLGGGRSGIGGSRRVSRFRGYGRMPVRTGIGAGCGTYTWIWRCSQRRGKGVVTYDFP